MALPETQTLLQRPQPMRFYIKITAGLQNGKVYNLVGASISLGRAPTNDIIIDDPNLSRNHAVFLLSAGHCKLKDLNSRNGIYVNSKRITQVELHHQDFIQLGDTEAIFIEMDKDIDLRGAPIAPSPTLRAESQSYRGSLPRPNVSSDGIPSQINISEKGGSLLRLILTDDPRKRNIRLFFIIMTFILGCLYMYGKSKVGAPPVSRDTSAVTPAPISDLGDTPSRPETRPAIFSGSPSAVYSQCLDLEDLGLFSKATDCYLSLTDFPGAKEGHMRVLKVQEDLSRRHYLAGQELFDIGRYDRALEEWNWVFLNARPDSEYFKLAAKGISKLNAVRKR